MIPASAFLLTLVVGINFFKSANYTVDVTQQLSGVSDEEIDEYLVENFDDDDLMAVGNVSEQEHSIIPTEIPNEDLEDYLNNSDNQTLEEEIL